MKISKSILCILTIIISSCQNIDLNGTSLEEKSAKYFSKSNHDYNNFSVSLKEATLLAKSHNKSDTFSIESLLIGKDTVSYLVNFSNSWMIIAGDKRITPIIAAGENETLDLKKSHKGLWVWLDSMNDDILCYIQTSKEINNEHTSFWEHFHSALKQSNTSIPRLTHLNSYQKHMVLIIRMI